MITSPSATSPRLPAHTPHMARQRTRYAETSCADALTASTPPMPSACVTPTQSTPPPAAVNGRTRILEPGGRGAGLPARPGKGARVDGAYGGVLLPDRGDDQDVEALSRSSLPCPHRRHDWPQPRARSTCPGRARPPLDPLEAAEHEKPRLSGHFHVPQHVFGADAARRGRHAGREERPYTERGERGTCPIARSTVPIARSTVPIARSIVPIAQSPSPIAAIALPDRGDRPARSRDR